MKNYCIDCNKEISIRAKRCHKCCQKGKLHSHYIDGRTLKKHYCIDCGNQVKNIYAIRCLKCLGKFNVGTNNPNYGNGDKIKGNKNPNYKNGLTSLSKLIRCSSNYKNWIKKSFERDQYTCQNCGQYSGNLEVHHIKQFSFILKEFLNFYNQFSPLEDKETLVRLAESYEPFWSVNNGITLCEKCHNETKLGRNTCV